MTARRGNSPAYFAAMKHDVFIQPPATDKDAGEGVKARRTPGQRPDDEVRKTSVLKLLRLIELTTETWAAVAPIHAPELFMLIDICVQELRGRNVTVTDACLAARVSCTSALRAIDHLIGEDMLCRYPDPGDARRKLLALTERSRTMISSYTDQFAATLET